MLFFVCISSILFEREKRAKLKKTSNIFRIPIFHFVTSPILLFSGQTGDAIVFQDSCPTKSILSCPSPSPPTQLRIDVLLSTLYTSHAQRQITFSLPFKTICESAFVCHPYKKCTLNKLYPQRTPIGKFPPSPQSSTFPNHPHRKSHVRP